MIVSTTPSTTPSTTSPTTSATFQHTQDDINHDKDYGLSRPPAPASTGEAPLQVEALFLADPPVDVELESPSSFFLLDGILHTCVGLLALTLPALLPNDALSLQSMGLLLSMLAGVQCVRSYVGRALPGFLTSLMEAVFKLVFGLVLCLYATSAEAALVVVALFVLSSVVANLMHADAFRPLPYLGGFRFISSVSAIGFVLLLLPSLNTSPLLMACVFGCLCLLNGCMMIALGLALKRMAHHQPLFHELWQHHHQSSRV